MSPEGAIESFLMLPWVDTWTDCPSCGRRHFGASTVPNDHVIICACGQRVEPSRESKMLQDSDA